MSAAEILGRSRTALAAPVAGVEVLTYDLDFDGVLGDMIPAEQAGRFTVEEMIDHDHAGRYRIVKLAENGQMVGGAADDPIARTRVRRYLRAGGRGYLLRFENADLTVLSLPALKRTALQTFIGLMQASSGQTLRQVERGGEACYEVDITQSAVAPGSLFALARARAVITVADSRLVEFTAAGAVRSSVHGGLRAAVAGRSSVLRCRRHQLQHHRAARRRRARGGRLRQSAVGRHDARTRRPSRRGAR